MSLWSLPAEKTLGDKTYALAADYRQILKILELLNDPALPEITRWQVALRLFYGGSIPRAHRQEAMQYLAYFISPGEETPHAGPRLLDWQQDADAIISGVNRVSGQEVRALPFLHWWTFLSWFHAIGEGQLSTLVAIRDKLARGKKLEDWERDFYRQNKHRVDLKKRYTPEELARQEQLKRLLDS